MCCKWGYISLISQHNFERVFYQSLQFISLSLKESFLWNYSLNTLNHEDSRLRFFGGWQIGITKWLNQICLHILYRLLGKRVILITYLQESHIWELALMVYQLAPICGPGSRLGRAFWISANDTFIRIRWATMNCLNQQRNKTNPSISHTRIEQSLKMIKTANW